MEGAGKLQARKAQEAEHGSEEQDRAGSPAQLSATEGQPGRRVCGNSPRGLPGPDLVPERAGGAFTHLLHYHSVRACVLGTGDKVPALTEQKF